MRFLNKDAVFAFFGKYKFVLLIALLGLILVLIPFGTRGKRAEPTESETAFDLREIEERLEDILSRGRGVGRVRIMLTLEKSPETVYVTEGSATRSENGSDEKTEVSKISSSGGEVPLVRESRSPVYRGALILCDGAGDPRVRLWVIEAVGDLLGLSSDRITVERMAEE